MRSAMLDMIGIEGTVAASVHTSNVRFRPEADISKSRMSSARLASRAPARVGQHVFLRSCNNRLNRGALRALS